MSTLILAPFVHLDSWERMRATLHPDIAERLSWIDNTIDNLGAAGSRNVGAREVMERGLDWLVDISPVTRFGPKGGTDFIEALADHPEALVVQAGTPVNWHCMAWSRRLFEEVGFFDENFWPIYGEDGDMAYRIHVHAEETSAEDFWCNVEVDAWVTMYGHSRKLAGIEPNMKRIWRYYEAKWDGRSGHERFTRPFGDPGLSLGFWPTPPDKRCSGLKP